MEESLKTAENEPQQNQPKQEDSLADKVEPLLESKEINQAIQHKQSLGRSQSSNSNKIDSEKKPNLEIENTEARAKATDIGDNIDINNSSETVQGKAKMQSDQDRDIWELKQTVMQMVKENQKNNQRIEYLLKMVNKGEATDRSQKKGENDTPKAQQMSGRQLTTNDLIPEIILSPDQKNVVFELTSNKPKSLFEKSPKGGLQKPKKKKAKLKMLKNTQNFNLKTLEIPKISSKGIATDKKFNFVSFKNSNFNNQESKNRKNEEIKGEARKEGPGEATSKVKSLKKRRQKRRKIKRKLKNSKSEQNLREIFLLSFDNVQRKNLNLYRNKERKTLKKEEDTQSEPKAQDANGHAPSEYISNQDLQMNENWSFSRKKRPSHENERENQTIKDLKKANQSLRKRINEMDRRREADERQLKKHRELVKQLERTVRKLELQVEDLERTRDEHERTRAVQERKISEMTRRNQKLESENLRLKDLNYILKKLSKQSKFSGQYFQSKYWQRGHAGEAAVQANYLSQEKNQRGNCDWFQIDESPERHWTSLLKNKLGNIQLIRTKRAKIKKENNAKSIGNWKAEKISLNRLDSPKKKQSVNIYHYSRKKVSRSPEDLANNMSLVEKSDTRQANRKWPDLQKKKVKSRSLKAGKRVPFRKKKLKPVKRLVPINLLKPKNLKRQRPVRRQVKKSRPNLHSNSLLEMKKLSNFSRNGVVVMGKKSSGRNPRQQSQSGRGHSTKRNKSYSQKKISIKKKNSNVKIIRKRSKIKAAKIGEKAKKIPPLLRMSSINNKSDYNLEEKALQPTSIVHEENNRYKSNTSHRERNSELKTDEEIVTKQKRKRAQIRNLSGFGSANLKSMQIFGREREAGRGPITQSEINPIRENMKLKNSRQQITNSSLNYSDSDEHDKLRLNKIVFEDKFVPGQKRRVLYLNESNTLGGDGSQRQEKARTLRGKEGVEDAVKINHKYVESKVLDRESDFEIVDGNKFLTEKVKFKRKWKLYK